MNTARVLSLIEQLEDNIDDLEENLEPLIEAALTTSTKKLPLLDKAKLYVVVVYAIESLLFSHLRLHGVAAKEHPVFRELTRVKQYFEKIKLAEEGNTKPKESLSLDKQAANRFIKHALSGNEKYDLERAEREAREKFLAKRKLLELEKAMREKAQAQAHLRQQSQQGVVNIEENDPQEIPDEMSEEGEIEDSNDNSTFVVQNNHHDVSNLNDNDDDDALDTTNNPQQTTGKRKRKTSNQGQDGTKLSKKAKKKARKKAAAQNG